jgi:hypothetical protein
MAPSIRRLRPGDLTRVIREEGALRKARAGSIVLAPASRYIAPDMLTPIGIGE